MKEQKRIALYGILLYLLIDFFMRWGEVSLHLFKGITNLDMQIPAISLLIVYYIMVMFFLSGTKVYTWFINKYIFLLVPILGPCLNYLISVFAIHFDVLWSFSEINFYHVNIISLVKAVLSSFLIILYFNSCNQNKRDYPVKSDKQKEWILYGMLLYLLVVTIAKWLNVFIYFSEAQWNVNIIIGLFLFSAYYIGIFFYFAGNRIIKYSVNKFLFFIIPMTFIVTDYLNYIIGYTFQESHELVKAISYNAAFMGLWNFALMIYIFVLYFKGRNTVLIKRR